MRTELTAVSVAIACMFAAGQAQANGINPTVVEGQASFSNQGSSLNITNSPGAIIHWQGFSIGANETTRFIQQSAASSVLNRVIGPDPSAILGALTSNGRVYLINPSGIVFGQGARIDVAGLVASTLNLSNQDFLAGRLNFTPNPLAGKVENQGTITTPSGGSVYLVGSNVSNSGIINSPQGDVILAAGQSVKIFDSSTPGVRVELTASGNAAVNLGEILAQSGQVGIYGAALRNTGIINADQVVRDASGKIVLRAKQDVTLEAGSRLSANGEQGGEITVQSDAGTTLVSGAVEAKGTQGEGGTIKILGNQVGLIDNASVNASGQTGGGTVLVGGDFHGANSNVQNATATYVGPDATIKADAIQSGNGGNVAVWADDTTRYYANISARGGANSGDGGFVEVSGKHYLDFLGIVNTLALAGKAGTLLLDPSDITISAGVDAGMTAPGTTSPFTGALATSTLNVTTLTDALALGNVLVDASAGAAAGTGNITVSTVITWSTAQTLELKAGNDVLVSAAFNADTAGAAIKLTAGHDVTANGALNAHGAGSAITLSAGHNVNVNAALVAPGAASAIELRAGNDGTGAGTVIFGGGGSANAPTTNIYYNPTSYANYAADKTAYSAFITGGIGALNTYMLLDVTGLSADKIYNGNTTAVLTGTPTITPAIGDTVNLAGTGSVANFSNKDVHTEVLTLSGYSISGTEAYKYSLFQPSNLSATISAKTVTLSAAKTYTGTTDLTGAVTLATGISGEALTYTGATASDAHVATAGKFIDAITLADGTGGTASNYALPTLNVANAPVTISTATLTPTLTNAGVTKTYDGGTTAPAGFTPTYSFSGLVSGDTAATLANTAAAYNDKDVLDANKVTVSGLSISGITGSHSSAASDYALDATSKDVLAAISAKTVTLSAAKTYTGTTDLTGAVTLATGISGEALTYTGATASDAHVATAGKFIDAITLADGTGGTASNYALPTLNVANAPVTITTKALTGSITAANKVYDANNSATILTRTLSGAIGGDTVSYTGGAALFSDKNVASGKTVTGTGLGLTGTDAGNYTVNSAATTTANITPAPLGIAANSTTRRYGDANPAFSATYTGFRGTDSTISLTGTLALTTPAGAASNVGNYAITPSGQSSTNYAISYVNGTLGVTPASLIVSADAKSKVYGTSDPALTFGATGLVNNDTAATVFSGALARASGETVAGGPYAITRGTLAANSNYTLSSFTSNTLAITPAALNVAANPQNKLFGTSDPALTFSVTGLVNNPALGIADSASTVLSGALTRVPGESALGGPYPITQGSLAANSNYTLGFTPNNLIITGAAAEPVLGFNAGQVIFAGVINNEFYYRPGNFWHISLNANNADPGFDVMRGTSDLKSRLSRSLNSCDSVSGGGFCETWLFPQQREKVENK